MGQAARHSSIEATILLYAPVLDRQLVATVEDQDLSCFEDLAFVPGISISWIDLDSSCQLVQ
jgi:hypothetical protein